MHNQDEKEKDIGNKKQTDLMLSRKRRNINIRETYSITNTKLGRKRSSTLHNTRSTRNNQIFKSRPNTNNNEDKDDDQTSSVTSFDQQTKKVENESIKRETKFAEQVLLWPSKLQIMLNNISEVSNNYLCKEKPRVAQSFLYQPYYVLPDLSQYLSDLIEVRISAEYLTTSNKPYKDRIIFGSDIYTSNSDAVLILQHSGCLIIENLAPTTYSGVSVYLRVSKNRNSYNSTTKFGIKSNKTTTFTGHSVKPEGFLVLSNLGNEEQLFDMASKMPLISSTCSRDIKYNSEKIRQHSFIPFMKENTFVLNLSFELSNKYDLSLILDKSHDNPHEYLSYSLKSNILYLETENQRFEISKYSCNEEELEGKKANELLLFERYEKFNVSEVLSPFSKDNRFMLSTSLPLSSQHTKPLFSKIDWDEFKWGEDFLTINTSFLISGIRNFKYYTSKQL